MRRYCLRLPWYRVLIVFVALLTLLVSLASATGSMRVSARGATGAAPKTPAAGAAAANVPAVTSKITLGDTSITGPALWTSSSGSVRGLLAWTGSDSAHHLNLLSSGDAVNWGGKATLSDTSPFHPAVARTGPNASDQAVLAWTGSDPNQSLNVLMGNPPSGASKLVLRQENSFTGPGVATLNGAIYLVWAGTDGQQTINVDRIVESGGALSVTQKTILWGWRSMASPMIIADPVGQRLLLSWTGPDQRLRFAYSTDGASWVQPYQSPLVELSGTSPMMFSSPTTNVSANLPRYFVAWSGIDPLHSVNVTPTTAFPEWPRSFGKAVLNEQAFGGPTLGSGGASGSLLMAWTGIDSIHHLNIATLSATYASACVPAAGAQPVSPVVISHGSTARREVSLTFDSDGGSVGNASAYLDILKSHQIHATFFLTGQFAQANPALVQRIANEGHDIGNHTVDHPDLAYPARTDTFVCNELTGADGTISGVDGRSTRPYFRPPYGSYNEQTQYLAAGLGYRTIMWNIDPRDWDANTTTQDILTRVLDSPNLGPGAIILMHVNSANEQYALDGVITGLQQRGYTIVPLSQLLR
ncbi:MAG TPA: polysaccharide deacetylase family protein [Ktedonobacterales bacterium]